MNCLVKYFIGLKKSFLSSHFVVLSYLLLQYPSRGSLIVFNVLALVVVIKNLFKRWNKSVLKANTGLYPFLYF